MALTLSDIDHLAKLTRLSLTDEEKELFLTQLNSILEYARQVQEVSVDQPLTAHSLKSLEEVAESDAIVQFPDADGLVAAAPRRNERSIGVPAVKDAS